MNIIYIYMYVCMLIPGLQIFQESESGGGALLTGLPKEEEGRL